MSNTLGGSHEGAFRKGGFGGCSLVPKNWSEGTLGCSPVPKTGTRVHSDVPLYQKPERGYIPPKPPFYKTALFFSFEDPRDPPVLKIVPRTNSARKEKFATAVAKHYGKNSEVLVCPREIEQGKRYTDIVKNATAVWQNTIRIRGP